MNIDLEVQKAIRARLVNTWPLLLLVDAENILDTNQRPNPVPSIILGDSQAVDEGTSLNRGHTRVHHTLHAWTREPSLTGVKEICGEIRTALHSGRLALPVGLACSDMLVSSMRFLRDPDGVHAHGVVVVEVLVSETGA